MIPKPGKKDKTDPRSPRPIALLSCVGKGFERLLAKRIANAALHEGLLSPRQAGAIPGKSAIDMPCMKLSVSERTSEFAPYCSVTLKGRSARHSADAF